MQDAARTRRKKSQIHPGQVIWTVVKLLQTDSKNLYTELNPEPSHSTTLTLISTSVLLKLTHLIIAGKHKGVHF